MMKFLASACAVAVMCACGTTDRNRLDGASSAKADTGNPGTPAWNVAVADSFVAAEGGVAYDARRDFDLTGDGKPETVAVHAAGARTDTMQVRLSILSATGDTLFVDAWNTQAYFAFDARSRFTAHAADSVVLSHLRKLLRDDAFIAVSTKGSGKAHNTRGEIDPDAVRYDIKENGVRAAMHIPRGTPLSPAALHAQEKFPVPDALVDSLVKDLEGQPAFQYFAGGEITSSIAWSRAKHRFVRIFACC